MKAVESEALGASQVVTWRDLKFTIPPADDWSLTFAHWADRDKVTRGLEAMLGPAQYEQFIGATPPPKMSEAQSLIESIMSAFGLDAGESSASTG